MQKLDPVLDLVDQAADTAREAVTDTRKATDHLYRTGEETRYELQKGMETVREDLQKLVENVKDEVSKLAEVAAETTRNTGRVSAQYQGLGTARGTYADALNSRLPTTHLSTLSRTGVREKQVLVDKDLAAETSQLQDLSEQELVAKANEALESMAAQLTNGLEGPRAVGTRKLRNGGVVYELNSTEAAQWVRSEKTTFTDGFGGASVIRERAISVIVEYVPVAHSPDAMEENRQIERDSGLSGGALLDTRWIKLPQRHAPRQRAAHLIAHFQNQRLPTTL